MRLVRITPRIDVRYWTAILIASMCGANLGDMFPDVFHIRGLLGLAILLFLFCLIVTIESMTRHGGEVYYWLALLVVRAAATSIADLAIASGHLSYLLAQAIATVVLAVLISLRLRLILTNAGDRAPADGYFWFTMLVAGILGTLVGDGLGHAFGSVELSVPISAMIATAVVAIFLTVWLSFSFRTATAFWCAIVAVRWWGTNVGDILAFVIGLPASLVVTGVVLALILVIWIQSKEPVRANA